MASGIQDPTRWFDDCSDAVHWNSRSGEHPLRIGEVVLHIYDDHSAAVRTQIKRGWSSWYQVIPRSCPLTTA